ncbi:hypothetical protein Pcinc_028745 [Petrolisthes cinctipes]|uniref:Uncharacterized protein n=1 Tax=Petrolisthes cinctipes TaxID=88211 RepID=A0AAE1F326_PETCI|nr:hypothetical protein Pcinc_028745 [Petrolisthes cinctipes]
MWPKSDRDTGYGSRDGLLRDRCRRDYDRGYGTCDTRDSDPWRREGGGGGGRTPDPLWPPRMSSPVRPANNTRDHRMPRVRSPERPDYQRAKSMHDLTQRRLPTEEERRASHDPRRRSMYDAAADAPRPLRESRSARRYRSQASLRHRGRSSSSRSSDNNSSASSCTHSVSSYTQLPNTRRYPGLDRATARPDPLDNINKHQHQHHNNKQQTTNNRASSRPDPFDQQQQQQHHNNNKHNNNNNNNKRTFAYPVNGGNSALHINRAQQQQQQQQQHEDYRRFRYDHALANTTPQFVRTSAPTRHY